MKQKILIVTRNLPPLIGGMERLNWHIADKLSESCDIYIISHHTARKTAPKNTNFYGAPLSPLPLFLIVSFLQTLWICLTKRVDILFAGSGLTAPLVVFWAKIFRKKSLVYIHGLDIGTDNKIYTILWIPFIRWADCIIANSSPTYEICISKKIKKEKITIIHPGISYPPKPRNEKIIDQLKTKYHLTNCKILISVGRLTERKGLKEFTEFSLTKVIQAIPNVKLVIIGDTPEQSLNKNLQSKESILSVAKQYGIEHNIVFTGNINDDEILSSFYYMADIHVFPVRHILNDPEGFGMVAIEAAAHDLITVAFATGGIIDAVENGVSGYLINNQDYIKFTETIIHILHENNLVSKSKAYAEQFKWENLAYKFNKILKRLN